MDSPVIEKKYSTASQKYIGTTGSSQQIIKKYNFLASKDDRQQFNSLKPIYQDEAPKKSLSPMNMQSR